MSDECPSCRNGGDSDGDWCRACGGTGQLPPDIQNPAHLLRRIESLEKKFRRAVAMLAEQGIEAQ